MHLTSVGRGCNMYVCPACRAVCRRVCVLHVERYVGVCVTCVSRMRRILDMSPTPTGLLQENDVATYAGFGAGQQELHLLRTQIDLA